MVYACNGFLVMSDLVTAKGVSTVPGITGTYGGYRYKFSGKHKKTKPVNFDTAASAACVNGGTRYWAFTFYLQLCALLLYNKQAVKSYLANALCIAALRQFKPAKYIRANTLMNELERARLKSEYLEYVNQLAGFDLLIIDDFGFMELDLDKCRDLFEVIDSRESRKSTMVVSQLPVKAWYELFADSTYADACLNRIIHKAYRLELNGRNMRNPN